MQVPISIPENSDHGQDLCTEAMGVRTQSTVQSRSLLDFPAVIINKNLFLID